MKKAQPKQLLRLLLAVSACTLLQANAQSTQPPLEKGKPPEVEGIEGMQETPSNSDGKSSFDPYEAKPTADPPPGWKIQLLENSKVENKTAVTPELVMTIKVEAYALVPIKSGEEEITVITDPYYNPLLKNVQEKTLGASVTKYSEQTKILRDNLKEVIEKLENSLKEAQNQTEAKEGDSEESDDSEEKTTDKKKK